MSAIVALRNLEKSSARGAARSCVLRRITAEIREGEFVSFAEPG